MSIAEQVEYAGNILIYTTPSGRGIRYIESEAYTSQSFKHVNPPGTYFQNFISWHSHPHPIVKNDYKITGFNRGVYPELDKNAFSPPSTGDFKLYINNWPNMQVHFVLDKYGYYVVDFTQDVIITEAYKDTLLNKCKYFRTKLDDDLKLNLREVLVTSTYNGIRYFHYDTGTDRALNEWKSFINKRYADAFRGEAIRCKFYTYRDIEHPIIHIDNENLVHATGGGVSVSNLWRPDPTPGRSPNNNVFYNAPNVLPPVNHGTSRGIFKRLLSIGYPR
jgi:hypothetical protein